MSVAIDQLHNQHVPSEQWNVFNQRLSFANGTWLMPAVLFERCWCCYVTWWLLRNEAAAAAVCWINILKRKKIIIFLRLNCRSYCSGNCCCGNSRNLLDRWAPRKAPGTCGSVRQRAAACGSVWGWAGSTRTPSSFPTNCPSLRFLQRFLLSSLHLIWHAFLFWVSGCWVLGSAPAPNRLP